MHAKNKLFLASGGNLKNAKNYLSCINEPLLVRDDDMEQLNTPILLMSVPPSLHLKLAFNSILSDLFKVWPGLLTFLKSKHIPTEAYHGGGSKAVVLEGNQVSILYKYVLKKLLSNRLMMCYQAWRSWRCWCQPALRCSSPS